MMFTGTSQQQDTRFSDKEKKLLKEMKFGDCLNKRVDMTKVKLEVLRPWLNKRITELLHIEDDVVTEFVYNQLEENKFPCPKKMQINMTGFLNGPNAREFMGELWSLLLAAQSSKNGIPPEFLEQKKEEIIKREEPPKIPKDYRPNALSSTHRERSDRRMTVDNLTSTSGGGGDSDNGNTLHIHLVSKNIDNHNTTQKEHDSRQVSPSTSKVRSESIKETNEKMDSDKLNVDNDKKCHKKSSSSNLVKEERRLSNSRKLVSAQQENLKSPKIVSSYRHSRERSTGRKMDRYRNSPSSTSYNRNHHFQHQQHLSRYKEDYRRSRSRSRRTYMRDRRHSSRSRKSPRYSRKKSPSPRKRRYSHSRRGRRSRSDSRRKYSTKTLKRSLSAHKTINLKPNGSDDRYTSNTTKTTNQRDLDSRRNSRRSINRQKSFLSDTSSGHFNNRKRSADWQLTRSNEGTESHRHHSPLRSNSKSKRKSNNEIKRSLPPSHQSSISLSPEPIRNNNMDYKYVESGNQRRQSQQHHQSSHHSSYQQQQQQQKQRYSRSGRASSASSGEYVGDEMSTNRTHYSEHQRYSRDRRFPKASWDSHKKNDGVRNRRDRSHSNRDQCNMYRRSSPTVTTNQSTMVDQYNKNYSTEYQYQHPHTRSGSRDWSYNNINYNIDNTQFNDYYNGNRRSDNATYGYRSSRDRNVPPSLKYASKRSDSPIRKSDGSREYKRYSRDRQPALSSEHQETKGQKSDEWNNQTNITKKSILGVDSDIIVTNTDNLRGDNLNQEKSNYPNNRNEQISTALLDTQNSKNIVDKSKFTETETIENCNRSSSVTTIRSENSDIEEKDNYSNMLGKCSQGSLSISKNEDDNVSTKMFTNINDGVINANKENAKEDNSEKKEKMETVKEISTNAINVDAKKERESIAISQLSLLEATAATEAASASLAATLEAALAGPSLKLTESNTSLSWEKGKPTQAEQPTKAALAPAPPYRFNRQTTSLSRTPSPFLKTKQTLMNWEKALLRTMHVRKSHGKKKKRRWVDSKNVSDVSDSDSRSDDDSEDDSDETDDTNDVGKGYSGKRKHKVSSSGDENSSQSNYERNKEDKKLRLQRKDKKRKNTDTSDESDRKKELSTSALKKYTKRTELTHKFSDKELLERSKCNFGVLTQEQEYTIATIMALRKNEKRKRNGKGENIAEGEYLKSGKFRMADSDDSDDIDHHKRVVREKVLRNAQKYQRHGRSFSNEGDKLGRKSPKSSGTSILPATMTSLDRRLTSPIKKYKKLMKKSSSVKNADNHRELLSMEYDDADVMTKKKSHKKHKKHSSKKSRKHKKHKKKSKRTSTVASSSDNANEDNDIVDIDDNSSISTIDMGTKVKTDSNLFIRKENNPNFLGNEKASSINEDLERQLRERALKSMKKNN